PNSQQILIAPRDDGNRVIVEQRAKVVRHAKCPESADQYSTTLPYRVAPYPLLDVLAEALSNILEKFTIAAIPQEYGIASGDFLGNGCWRLEERPTRRDGDFREVASEPFNVSRLIPVRVFS